MVAQASIFRDLHGAQQRVHFGQGQVAVGPHGTSTGKGGQHVEILSSNAFAGAKFSQLAQHVLHHLLDIGLGQQHGDFAHDNTGQSHAFDN